ncbi:lipocalin family protein [Pseudanabaena sp. ABRG5-3]|uniref:lipocalin family protein n=1 Tax=Pseudanabaena sp. ABRG5-3 TaxID=685565 RepID=UPI0011AE36B5|nr:lipocalin family protein [Pseudanabaena sp. ABRG5-3]
MIKKRLLILLSFASSVSLTIGCKQDVALEKDLKSPPPSSTASPSSTVSPSSLVSPFRSSSVASPSSTSYLSSKNEKVSSPSPKAETINENPRFLVGHWRETSVNYDVSKDVHLVLAANGTAARWSATVAGRSPKEVGTWKVKGKNLILELEGYEKLSRPFTIHEGDLVFPNISNKRRYWEKIRN